jgi:hypothetical protein
MRNVQRAAGEFRTSPCSLYVYITCRLVPSGRAPGGEAPRDTRHAADLYNLLSGIPVNHTVVAAPSAGGRYRTLLPKNRNIGAKPVFITNACSVVECITPQRKLVLTTGASAVRETVHEFCVHTGATNLHTGAINAHRLC